jgi:hypothetical protein
MKEIIRKEVSKQLKILMKQQSNHTNELVKKTFLKRWNLD